MAKSNKNNEQSAEMEALQAKIRADQEYVIRNKRVRRQTRRRAFIIILLIFLLIIALLTGATYAIMRFVDESNFRVTVTQTGTAWLSLSKDSEFSDGGSSVLDVSAPKNMDNTSLCNILDQELLDMIAHDGTYDGAGADMYYIASTFYLKNSGYDDVEYKEAITLERAMRGMEKAIRVILIKDEDPDDDLPGTIVAYAAYASGAEGKDILDEEGNPIREEVVPSQGVEKKKYKPLKYTTLYDGLTFDEEDFDEEGVWLAKPFAEEGYIHKSEYFPLKAQQRIKYTILIWLEGEDPQCVGRNDSVVDAERGILGGQVKISVEFTAQNSVITTTDK